MPSFQIRIQTSEIPRKRRQLERRVFLLYNRTKRNSSQEIYRMAGQEGQATKFQIVHLESSCRQRKPRTERSGVRGGGHFAFATFHAVKYG